MNNIEKKIDKIIEDLILLDPELKKIETRLREIILDLIKNKPEIVMQEKFEQELKLKIMQKITELKESEGYKNVNFFNKDVFLKKLSLSLGTIMLSLLIILPIIGIYKTKDGNDLRTLKISRLEDNAFGDISFQENSGQALSNQSLSLVKESALDFSPEMMTRELPGYGAGSNETGFSASVMRSDIAILPYFEYPKFIYKYEGDDLLEIIPEQEKIDVYKKAKNNYNSSSLLSSVTFLAADLINLKKFNHKQSLISHLSITEDKEFGYIINLDLLNGNISLYQNWSKWPNNNCEGRECLSYNNFKYEDLISNQEAIKIAESFIKEFAIKRDNYGEAKINYDFHKIYEESENKIDIYVPEEISVVFPYLIEGKEVKDESGEAYGLYISVNSRYKKVTNVNNLSPSRYQASAYTTLKDVEEIKKLAEQGGVNRYQDPNTKKEIIVKLGTPNIILSKQHHYNQKNMTGEELFIPALSFPVIGLSEESEFFYQKNVVIPLVKELINNNSGAIIMPYPITR